MKTLHTSVRKNEVDKIVQKQIQQSRCEVGEDVDDQNLQYYCMATNFQGLKHFAVLADQS